MHASVLVGKNKLLSVGRNPMLVLLRYRASTMRPIRDRSPLAASLLSFSTSASTSLSWVTTEYPPEDNGRVALVRMNRKPANALSLELCAELSETIQTIRSQNHHRKQTTAVVLASSLPGIFSAGLDIGQELYQPDADRLPKFWWQVQQLFLDLYGCSQLTTVAALGGHAPAAGCMLALSCDYRIILDSPSTKTPPSIGLNESHLGIVAPPWMARQFIDVLGHRRGELALLQGTMFPPNAALERGLVDQLLTLDDNKEPFAMLEETALAKAREFARIPPQARAAVKDLTRSPLVEQLVEDRERDIDDFCTFVTSETVQRNIGAYLEALRAKTNAKGKTKTKSGTV
mmetsp:Transcript_28946/g.67981  ORF Transcript_28946/g.67981 Transcript_28946/m.67981 type:complete len:345 (+) Transcript_28946:210-1244(+)